MRQRCRAIDYPPVSVYIGQTWLHRFCCEDPTIPEASPASLNLPLSTTFGDGRHEFKSGWDPDGATNTNWAVRFHATRWETLNDGREPGILVGHYEVHRKGPQTIMRELGRARSDHARRAQPPRLPRHDLRAALHRCRQQ